MASVILTAAGYAVGAALPGIGPLAAPLLGAVGGIVGGTIDARLGLAPTQSATGPRLESLRVQDSREGAPLPILYGMLRTAGNIVWASPLLETRHKTSSGGGKGGASARVTTYSYAVHLAITLGAGPITGVHRIWADSKLIFDGARDPAYTDAIRVYPGLATQAPDALLESYLGLGNVPAYRNTAYLVIENLQLEAFGNRIPNLTFEVEGQSGGFAPATPQALDLADNDGGVHPPFYVSDNLGGLIVSPGLIALGSSTYRFAVDHHRWQSGGFMADGRVTTATFTSAPCYVSSALSPDRSKLFLCTIAAGGQLQIVLYDIATRSFGPLTTYSYPAAIAIYPGAAWLDGQTVILPANNTYYNGPLAIQCLGLTPLPLPSGGTGAGYFLPLWPVDGNHDWIEEPFALPTDVSNMLLVITTNMAKTKLFGARIAMQGGQLQATALPDVTLGTVTGMGSITGQRLLPLFDGTLLRIATTTSGMFIAQTLRHDANGFASTRAAASLPVSLVNLFDVLLPALGSFVLLSADNGHYGGAELALTDTGFAVTRDYTIGTGAAPEPTLPRAARLGPYDFALRAGKKLFRFQRGSAAQSVGAILDDLAKRTGLAPADTDRSAGDATLVAGFAVTQPMGARRAIENLLAAYPFSLAESDGLLRLTDLRSANITTLPDSALHATHDDRLMETSTTRAQARDIPRALALDFYDADNLYQPGTARAAIDADPAAPAETTTLPLVLNAGEAQRLAARLLMRAQAERTQLSCAVARDYQQLDPGDLVTVGGRSYSIAAIHQQGGLLQISATGFSASALDGTATSLALPGPVTPPVPGATLYALDLPPLRDSDGEPGIYLAAQAAPGWQGGIVYDSTGNERARLGLPVTLGVATTVLPDGSSLYSDRAATVTVVTTAPLISCTMDALLTGSNLALLGGELLQFQTATLIAPQTYTLGTLLRGRFGTHKASAIHASGERFFLLEESALARLDLTLADRGRTTALSLVSLGQNLDSVLPLPVTYGLVSLKPFSPVTLKATAASGDITIGWTRRARINNGWVDNIELPLDAATESYALDLYSGTTFLRSVTVAAPTYLYTAAQQTADFGGAVTALTVTVAQISDRYGRGSDATASFSF